jgi:hypothetical protein
MKRILRGSCPPAEDREVTSTRNGKDQRLGCTLSREVSLDAAAELGRVDADNIVLATVVTGGAAEDTNTDLLLVDLGSIGFQGLVTDIKKEVAEASRPSEVGAAGDAVDESAADR